MIIVESILLILEKNNNKMKYLTVMNGADHS